MLGVKPQGDLVRSRNLLSPVHSARGNCRFVMRCKQSLKRISLSLRKNLPVRLRTNLGFLVKKNLHMSPVTAGWPS